MYPSVHRDISIIRGIAATGFIFAISAYIPVLGFFFSLLIPLPTIICRSKFGRTHGAIVPIVSAIVISLVIGQMSVDMFFFLELLFLGTVLGELFEKNFSIEKTMLYACGAVLGAGSFLLLLYSQTSSMGLGPMVSDYVARNLQLSLALYEKIGVSQENLNLLSESLEKVHYLLVRIIPSLLVSLLLFATWVILLMSRYVLKGYNLFCPDFGELKLWKPPEHLVWTVIGCGFLIMSSSKGLKLLGINGLIILMTVYFLGGIAIVSFYFEKKRFPRFLRIVLYTLIVLLRDPLLFVVGLGFFDLWLDIRKLKTNKSEE